MAIDTFPSPGHDHGRCVARIMAAAQGICGQRQARLTAPRLRVLEILAESHRAIGAYEIIDRLAVSGRRPAPIAVYRALEFLIEQGFAHRLASRNAFVACEQPGAAHAAQFLICRDCGAVGEMNGEAVARTVEAEASAVGFLPETSVVEIEGICGECGKRGAAATVGR